jgi:hypothetical protein
MKHLLIGGTNDDKRVAIPDGVNHFQMKCKNGHKWEYGGPNTPVVLETETYERQYIRANNREFDVFAIQGITSDELIIQLIAGYKA